MAHPKRMLVGIIADRETTICFLLAGIGEQRGDNTNFLIVENETTDEKLFKFFEKLYNRKDICVIFIGCDVANRMKAAFINCKKDVPIIMKIPSKKYLEKLNEESRFTTKDIEQLSEIFDFS